MSRHPLWSALALLVALTVLLTWPQALHLGTKVAAHDDPFFSIWRLAWVAHALPSAQQHLFDANIFHPHVRTLAYSDAMLLEATLAAPRLWAHVNPVLVYNLLLLAGIVSSGLGMFVLARHLTGDLDAALVLRGGIHARTVSHRALHAPRAAMDCLDAAGALGRPPHVRGRIGALWSADRSAALAADDLVRLLRRGTWASSSPPWQSC